ncbi:MAG: Lycopene cyclase [Anaerolineae bacterium]|nr:Lycopene cyclase [Anaerolineae bacterium]
MKPIYDYIFAGGGAAGLSLASRLIRELPGRSSILILDKDKKDQNDRTWCFWSAQPSPFDEIVTHSWVKLRFVSDGFEKTFDIRPYRYAMIRGIDFYRYTHQELRRSPQVDFIQENVISITDYGEKAIVKTENAHYFGRWIFDSMFRVEEFVPNPARYHYVMQHFKGWEIETKQDIFDPEVFTMFDFRTPQQGAMRFIYILPFSTRSALVEYTLFSATLLNPEEYDAGLKQYLQDILGVQDYKITAIESGKIPMTDHPFPRKSGLRIMNIGTKGGMVKPSTGYAFQRIQRDCTQIIESIKTFQTPDHVPQTRSVHKLNDSIMLQLMYRRGDLMHSIFTDLFRNNPIDRLFRFLDEESSWLDDLLVKSSLNPIPFLQALIKIKIFRKV